MKQQWGGLRRDFIPTAEQEKDLELTRVAIWYVGAQGYYSGTARVSMALEAKW